MEEKKYPPDSKLAFMLWAWEHKEGIKSALGYNITWDNPDGPNAA